MSLPTQPPDDYKVVPTTPHVKVSPIPDADPIPATPVKPKVKVTTLALNDETSDFAIICEGQRFITHRSILETSSPYFSRMFRFNGSVGPPIAPIHKTC
jgi:hypothetical protein